MIVCHRKPCLSSTCHTPVPHPPGGSKAEKVAGQLTKALTAFPLKRYDRLYHSKPRLRFRRVHAVWHLRGLVFSITRAATSSPSDGIRRISRLERTYHPLAQAGREDLGPQEITSHPCQHLTDVDGHSGASPNQSSCFWTPIRMYRQHFGFSAERLVRAMVNEGGGDQSVAFLIDLQEQTQVARLVLLIIAMFLGDVVIVRVSVLPCMRLPP